MKVINIPSNFKYVSAITSNEVQKCYKIEESSSPIKIYKFLSLYIKSRKERPAFLKNILYTINSSFRLLKLRMIKDESNNLLVGYTYKIQKNKCDEKSMFVDAFARNLDDKKRKISKSLSNTIYLDMKAVALKNKVKEFSLYVTSKDVNLRHNYEKLGLKIDNNVYIEKFYLMKTRIEKFLNTQQFKLKKYNELTGKEYSVQKKTV